MGLTFPGIIDDPGSFSGNINSPYPALGPEPKNLISFEIFIKATAQVFNVPEKLTIFNLSILDNNLLHTIIYHRKIIDTPTANMYLLAKIHKEPLKTRAIISSSGSICSSTSDLGDFASDPEDGLSEEDNRGDIDLNELEELHGNSQVQLHFETLVGLTFLKLREMLWNPRAVRVELYPAELDGVYVVLRAGTP